MTLLQLFSWRFIVLVGLWALPCVLYLVIGLVALYEAGWLMFIAWTLPPMWLLAWAVGRLWTAPKLANAASSQPLTAPDFWTPQDAAAISVVEQFRAQVPDIDQASVADPNRYFRDARAITELLAAHYHQESSANVFHSLTIVELLAVIHLSIEDVEEWVLGNIPGSNLVTVRRLEQLPHLLKTVDLGQKLWFLTSAIVNPIRLLSYPLWRNAGHVTVEIQSELMRSFYQIYLRQVGYYLIEMYSGRLKAGSKHYRQQFGHIANAVHASGGDMSRLNDLQDVTTTIAVMGQVKAGKSSFINLLMKDKVATTSVLPETRAVKRYDYRLAESKNFITLLDTPGYSEANVSSLQLSEITAAARAADIILLILAANSPAREADLQMVREVTEYYRQRTQLKPPPIIAVLTHIDLLRPVREWSPPYNWQNPKTDKEQAIAKAVGYAKELFGSNVAEFACVFTGENHLPDSSVADDVIPLLVKHLDHGHAAALLKAFYQQLDRRRFQQLVRQLFGLFKSS